MKFNFKADITFTAEDLDAAFLLLETHFRKLQEDEDEAPWFIGEMSLGRPE